MTVGRAAIPAGLLVPATGRVSFVYVEKCVVHRDSNAVTATDDTGTLHVPAAMIGVLLLGPGTRITHQAVVLLADSGATIAWVGEDGVRLYAHGTPIARSTRLLEAQARLVTSRRGRIAVARQMYGLRFPGEDVSHLTMQQLRGREGARIRAAYRAHANRTGVEWSARRYDPQDWSAGDPVNRALSAANACLYGAVNAAVVALGCSPGLGFVHTGHARAFVYDIADLYKAEISIPAAFDVAAAGSHEIGSRARRHVRDLIYDGHLIDRAVDDIHRLLVGPTVDQPIDDADVVSLWDDAIGVVPGGTAYASEQP